MKTRHRTPTIFSIYMVDVLCCALGCVVLLWQYNLNEAEEKTAEANRKNEDLLLTMDKLSKATFSLDTSNTEKIKLESIVAAMEKNEKQLTQRATMLESLLREKDVAIERQSRDLKVKEKELGEKSSQYILLKVDLDKALIEQAKLTELAVTTKKNLDEAKAAEALARKLLAEKSLAFDNLKKDSDVDIARLAQNTKRLEALLADQENDRKTLTRDLKEKSAQYLLLRVELDKATAERARLSDLTVSLKKDYDDAKAAEALAKKAGGELEKLLAELRIDYKNLSQQESNLKKNSETDLAKLAQSARLIVDLNKKIADADLELARVKTALDKAARDAEQAGVKIGETKTTLADSLERQRKLAKQIEKLEDDLDKGKIRQTLLDQDNTRLRNELAEYKDRYKDLSTLNARELKAAQELAARLKLENVSLSDKVVGIQKNIEKIEKRFAGIVMAGSRVIMLVDMSGSMGYVDENTPDPDKWPLVADTIGSIMLSLPNLKQYQVILFNNGITYPLGRRGQWHDFEGQKSIDNVVKQVKGVKPQNGTDIYAAFNEVFSYRTMGLDTVYFFSDGLPTVGEGLPPGSDKLSEQKKTELLSNHVRKQMKVWNGPLQGQPRVRVNTIGFFYESPDVGSFLWALAREHDGSFVGMSKP